MTSTGTGLNTESMHQLMYCKLNIPRMNITNWDFAESPMPVFVEPEDAPSHQTSCGSISMLELPFMDEGEGYILDELDFGTPYHITPVQPVAGSESEAEEEEYSSNDSRRVGRVTLNNCCFTSAHNHFFLLISLLLFFLIFVMFFFFPFDHSLCNCDDMIIP
jgi:hypothetical protein